MNCGALPAIGGFTLSLPDTLKDETVASGPGLLTSLKLELAYFGGRAWSQRQGAGTILRLQRVRPSQKQGFQPLRSHEITPGFLDRAIGALKRWNYDIVSIDEACRRAVVLSAERRFVCLTFDGAYKDIVTNAHPVLARHRVPFTVYVPTAFPDGIGQAWWLALDQVIAKESRISMMIGRDERHFNVAGTAEKYQLFDLLFDWIRTLEPKDASTAIKDLCTRYNVDLAEVCRSHMLDWNDIATLATDPLVTFGVSTVNFVALSRVKDSVALREMSMGKAVLEAALRCDVKHFAYPFGDQTSWQHKHMAMAEEAGFVSAVSALPDVVKEAGQTPLLALPRIGWDGRRRSLRAMRVVLSGAVSI
jgi:peptidoglycan/xylan/chitin deacetylase (PgdA/CDA1 family)